MDNGNERFEYTYSASQQAEIEAIRRKYLPKQDDKMEQIRKLDEKVSKPGTICGIVLGVIGTLIFGAGMSMALVWTETMLIAGVLFGCVGFGLMGMAYPVYKKLTEMQKEKYAKEILALTEQLLH